MAGMGPGLRREARRVGLPGPNEFIDQGATKRDRGYTYCQELR